MQRSALIVVLLIVSMLMVGCSPIVEDAPYQKNVYATFYPIYALASAITEDAENMELHCLVQPQDGCLRSYELSDWDLYMLAYSADAVLSAGNRLENFADKLESMGENMLPMAEVMYGLETYRMNESNDEESHFAGENPHLYMSVEGAEAIAENIAGTLMVLDEANSEIYQSNLSKLLVELQSIQDYIKKQTEFCANVPAMVLNEALFYTATDCGLDITGCFERENSEMLYGKQLDDCLETLEKAGTRLVLIEEQAPYALVKTLEDARYVVVKLDTMSSMAEKDGISGYLQVLKRNAGAIAAACKMIQG